MKLMDLVKHLFIKEIVHDNEIEITGLAVDSRKVKEGDLFICIPGFKTDGHQFAHQAVSLGAKALMVERILDVPVTQIIVPDVRRAMAIVADTFFGQPTHHLDLIGVTGTNGKTTVTYLLEAIFREYGKKTGLIGTIHMKIGDETEEVKNTTPDVFELQHSFRRMVDAGVEYAMMEVSSHALEMGRVRGCRYKTAIFTNLTQDHLDYHGTMEQYKQAKGLLFSQLGNTYHWDSPSFAILNQDDEASLCYAKMTSAQVVSYGIKNKADVMATDLKISSTGTSFTVKTPAGEIPLKIKLIGMFSIYNSLAAISAAVVENVPLPVIQSALEKVPGVNGRFEKVDEGQDFTVIVDYAHTPDSLENVLKTIRDFATGKVYCVVGCGGDRDKTKRPIMASIAAKYSNVAVITSDNPRSEEPQAIIDDMVQGLKERNIPRNKYVTMVDRKQAIQYAINEAQKDDVILIAGKGHETYQIIKGEVLPFDDRLVAKEAIRSKKK
ncbi:UDP-N-acetylmuramoyl-L-alanyl-D-glutamate--2,6-diaminopimelate ligase [Microaerobacter geothermalis]|uniref:UDP-N-acetylmuramoyl-L-alanyl-D-glutamate--2, 6-diaminopimelate ligase n=1 Tax=Microaerobacter geothermalis TaxID=674972 RepID=UPI0038B34A59